jgi:hypothetical protein
MTFAKITAGFNLLILWDNTEVILPVLLK